MQPVSVPIKLYKQNINDLLTKGINDILSFFGVKKTDWQILHSIHEKACICKTELAGLMHPFADAATVHAILIKFKIMHIVFDAEEKVSLTSNGIDLYKNCLQQQELFRQQLMNNVTE